MSLTLKEKIAVMQAALDGADMQITWDGATGWHDIYRPEEFDWNWGKYDYRIKPQPKEIWVNEYDSEISAHRSRASAEEWCSKGGVTKLYREVVE